MWWGRTGRGILPPSTTLTCTSAPSKHEHSKPQVCWPILFSITASLNHDCGDLHIVAQQVWHPRPYTTPFTTLMSCGTCAIDQDFPGRLCYFSLIWTDSECGALNLSTRIVWFLQTRLQALLVTLIIDLDGLVLTVTRLFTVDHFTMSWVLVVLIDFAAGCWPGGSIRNIFEYHNHLELQVGTVRPQSDTESTVK